MSNKRGAMIARLRCLIARGMLLALAGVPIGNGGEQQLGLAAQQQAQPAVVLQAELDARYRDFERGAINEAAFTNAIIATSADQANINDSLRVLQAHRGRITEAVNSTQLHREIALLAEMTAQYGVAIDSYQQISKHTVAGSAEHADALLKLAALHFNNGDFAEALAAAQQVLVSATGVGAVHRAYILQTRIEGYGVSFSTAIQKLDRFIAQNNDSPQLRLAYVTLIEFYYRDSDVDKAERAQRVLSVRFPDSIEAGYSYGNETQNMMSLPLPAILLRNSEENILRGRDHGYALLNRQPLQRSDGSAVVGSSAAAADGTAAAAGSRVTAVSSAVAGSIADGIAIKIQTGSFRSRVYADSLQRRLEALGLTAVVNTVPHAEGAYYKVRVLATDRSYPAVLDTLSQHNITGFLTND